MAAGLIKSAIVRKLTRERVIARKGYSYSGCLLREWLMGGGARKGCEEGGGHREGVSGGGGRKYAEEGSGNCIV